jgi:hypothetical protein
MSEQAETYVKKTAEGETKERTVFTAADRVAAKFAGYRPKKTRAAAKPTDKAADAK